MPLGKILDFSGSLASAEDFSQFSGFPLTKKKRALSFLGLTVPWKWKQLEKERHHDTHPVDWVVRRDTCDPWHPRTASEFAPAHSGSIRGEQRRPLSADDHDAVLRYDAVLYYLHLLRLLRELRLPVRHPGLWRMRRWCCGVLRMVRGTWSFRGTGPV